MGGLEALERKRKLSLYGSGDDYDDENNFCK